MDLVNKLSNLNLNLNLSLNKKQHTSSQQTIYWDVDDVILNSAETVIDYLNITYNIPNNLPVKTSDDLKDWMMRSIYKDLTHEQLQQAFRSDYFWEHVQIKKEFIEILNNNKIFKNYNQVFITKGCKFNLERKEKFLRDKLGDKIKDFKYIGLQSHAPKSQINMANGIQIDDNLKNLNTNAKVKILLTNNRQTAYNNCLDSNNPHPDNLYILNTLEDVEEFLKFNLLEKF